MNTDLQNQMASLQKSILDEDYYSARYIHVVANQKMTVEGIANKEYTDPQLITLAHYFWEALPDSPQIRRGPFFQLCDIAERIFDE